jgi:hypothetical protein
MKEFLVTILDGSVKSPTAALRFIFRHCGVLVRSVIHLFEPKGRGMGTK